ESWFDFRRYSSAIWGHTTGDQPDRDFAGGGPLPFQSALTPELPETRQLHSSVEIFHTAAVRCRANMDTRPGAPRRRRGPAVRTMRVGWEGVGWPRERTRI